MKKPLFITAAVFLVLGMVLAILFSLYFPYWNQQAVINRLEKAGYEVHSAVAPYKKVPPFSDHLSSTFRRVPSYVRIHDHSDRRLLPLIAANPHVQSVATFVNLSTAELNHFNQSGVMWMAFSGAQDPRAYFASDLVEKPGFSFSLWASARSPKSVSPSTGIPFWPDLPLSPEWLEQWMRADNIHTVSIKGDVALRPSLPLLFNRSLNGGPRRVNVLDVPLTKADLASLNGEFDWLRLKRCGVQPSWIPASCRSKDLSIRGSGAFSQAELDTLLDGRFGEVLLDSCTASDITRFQAAGIKLHATNNSP